MFVKYIQFSFLFGFLASTVLATEVINIDGLFNRIGNSSYYVEHKLHLSWLSAYDACRRLGSELITIDTIEEWNAINKYLKDNDIMGEYWTSGTDAAEHGKHIWFSNGERITLDIWSRGQPDNHLLREHCDALGYVPKRHKKRAPGLNDRPCKMALAYICEASPLKTPQIIKN